MSKNCCVSCFGVFCFFVLAVFFAFSAWVLNKVEIKSDVIAEPAVSECVTSSSSNIANKKDINPKCNNETYNNKSDSNLSRNHGAKSYTSSKVFYLVYVLGVLAILAVVSLATLRMAGKHCLSESKIGSADDIWNDVKALDIKEITVEKNPSETISGNPPSTEKKCDEKKTYSYGSFEKVVNHLAGCIAEA